MAAFYYTISALPSLDYDGSNNPDIDWFLRFCEETIPAPWYEKLTKIPKDPIDGLASDVAILDQFARFEAGLRNEIVRLRVSKLGLSYDNHAYRLPSGEDFTQQTDVADIAREAVSHSSPLEGERILDRARMRKIDELSVGHSFDFTVLVAYRLKLSILARNSLFTRDLGETQYKESYETISEQTQEHVQRVGE